MEWSIHSMDSGDEGKKVRERLSPWKQCSGSSHFSIQMELRIEFLISWANHELHKESNKKDKKHAMQHHIRVVSSDVIPSL